MKLARPAPTDGPFLVGDVGALPLPAIGPCPVAIRCRKPCPLTDSCERVSSAGKDTPTGAEFTRGRP